jgi:heme A synthase
MTNKSTFQNWETVLLVLLNVSTFSLVTLGGVVHNTGSSLACPDWPLCFGQIIPKMEGAVAIEHSHRLLATFVGILTLVWLFRTHTRKTGSVWKEIFLSRAATALVIFQGLLGGLTVILKISPLMSTAHLVTSQIYLAVIFLGLLAHLYRDETSKNNAILPDTGLFKFGGWVVMALLLQIGLGAFIRHSGASVSCGLGPAYVFQCVDMDSHELQWWPWHAPGQFNMLHRYFAFLLGAMLIASTLKCLKVARRESFNPARIAGISIHALLVVQIFLGFMTLYTGIDVLVVTLHLVVGMSLWLSVWNFWIQCGRLEARLTTSVSAPRLTLVKSSEGSS